jgi:hypothetical protein
MASFFSRWFMSEKEKNQELNSDDKQRPPTVAPLKRVQNYCMTSMEQEGYKDATMYRRMQDGLVKIKQLGLLICDEAISEIKTDIRYISVGEQVRRLIELEQSIAAAKVESFKSQKDLEISMIEEKKKQLEENENLPVYVTYRQGYNNGELANEYGMSNK